MKVGDFVFTITEGGSEDIGNKQGGGGGECGAGICLSYSVKDNMT